ncbi:MAG: MBL fold metallo-hydrolase, partial [Anaerolineae bacterium]|nr:MBL fold metallo-hydrolase [Anaerolineae bacterium]
MEALSGKPKITCIVDNAVQPGSRLWGEHGLAFLVEIGDGRVLFDTGQSGTVLLHNLAVLGVDPATIDALVISHAHYDHTGGLPALLERTRSGLPFYAHPNLFRERFARHRERPEFIGLPLKREALRAQTALRLSAEPQQILPSVWTTGEIALRPEPVGDSPHHLVRKGEVWVPDLYQDDMALVVEGAAGLVLLCGCCHAGLLNTLSHVQRAFERPIVAIAGGTHLASASPDHLRRVGQTLLEVEAVQRVYLNHCSGQVAFH